MVDEVWRRSDMVDEVRKRRRGPITQACKVDLGTLTSGFSFLVLLCSGSLVLAIWTCLYLLIKVQRNLREYFLFLPIRRSPRSLVPAFASW